MSVGDAAVGVGLSVAVGSTVAVAAPVGLGSAFTRAIIPAEPIPTIAPGVGVATIETLALADTVPALEEVRTAVFVHVPRETAVTENVWTAPPLTGRSIG